MSIGSKYDMRALLSRAGKFLEANVLALTSTPSSQQFAWKWITLADKAGLPDVATACIDAIMAAKATARDAVVAAGCKKEVLLQLSPAVCCHLAAELAEALAWQRQQFLVKERGSGPLPSNRSLWG
jgi:hypothetical protein